jgi:hypothetical protein
VRYPQGQPIRLSTTVRDFSGTLINAGTLSLTVKKPDATTQVYAAPTNDSTGTYHQDIPATDLAQLGHYLYVWTATGTGAGVSNSDFDVFDPLEQAVLPLQDAKAALNITVSTYDSELQMMIATAVDAIENITGGPLFTRSVTERVRADNLRTIALMQRPVVSVTSITDVASGSVVAISDIEIDSNAGIVRRKLELPFWGWGPYYTVVYTAGWGTVLPAAFNQAARIIVSHLWQIRQGPNSAPPSDAYSTLPAGYGQPISERAVELLAPYAQEAYI